MAHKTTFTLLLFGILALIFGFVPRVRFWNADRLLSTAVGRPSTDMGTALTVAPSEVAVQRRIDAVEARLRKVRQITLDRSLNLRLPELSLGPKTCEPRPGDETQLHIPCVDWGFTGCERYALDAFIEALHETDESEAESFTRVLHYGDSAIAGDDITRTLRRLFQKRFGAAGPGFIYIDRPWTWYGRDGVRMLVKNSWTPQNLIFGHIKDGMYGLGGINFDTWAKGVRTRIELRDPPKEGPLHVELFYLEQPSGGDLKVRVNDKHEEVIKTASKERRSGFYQLTVDEPPEKIEIETASWKQTRAYGVVIETGRGGVIWDAIGIVGARAVHLNNYDEAHLKRQLERRNPNLVVLQFGLNEAQMPSMPGKAFRRRLAGVIKKLRQAVPDASCLVVGPYDNATFEGGRLKTKPIIPKLVAAQRQVALEAGCAFWDSFEAMGGKDSLSGWYRNKPRLISGDLTHLTRAGAEVFAKMLYTTLIEAYQHAERCGAR